MDKEKGLVAQDESALGHIVITEAQVELIKKTVAQGANDDELKLFFFECRRRGVHPLDRLIHFVKRGSGTDSKVAFQCGIDFMRAQAEASGEYRGQDDIEYGATFVLSDTLKVPEYAKATVRRKDPDTGEIYSVSASARWDEYYPGEKLGFMWRKMPHVMLGKCAESQALRKAFPRQIGGLYSFEEMEQADIVETPNRPPISRPQAKGEAKTQGGEVISPGQVTRFYAIAKGTGAPNETIKDWLLKNFGFASSKDITRETYEDICERVKELGEPGASG